MRLLSEKVTTRRDENNYLFFLLSHFLTLAAGGPVAVLEVSCLSRNDDGCTFAFGSEDAVHRLHRHLVEGLSLDEALARL